jgi:hypothetical protein
MRTLIAAVFSVAALLSVSSGAFAQGAQIVPAPPPQGAQPIPGAPPAQGAQPAQPIPSASTTSLSEYSPTYEEHGRYHPCPSSVRFNGRNACLGCPTHCNGLPSDLTAH